MGYSLQDYRDDTVCFRFLRHDWGARQMTRMTLLMQMLQSFRLTRAIFPFCLPCMLLFGLTALAADQSVSSAFLLDDPADGARLDDLARPNDGLRILWWNIEYGRQNQLTKELAREQLGPLEQNLLAIIRSPLRPDVLALGEYERAALSPEVVELIEAQYRFARFTPYNPRSTDRGMAVFCLPEVNCAETTHAPLPYTPLGADACEDRAYRGIWKDVADERFFDRTFLDYEVRKGGKVFHLLPLHTVQPWSAIKLAWGGGLLGTAATALSLLFGRTNPLVHQLSHFKQLLTQRFGTNLDHSRLVVVGDFNTLAKFGPKSARPYRLAAQGLSDPFAARAERASWPATSSDAADMQRPMKIDHAFHSAALTADSAEVLSLPGSDHYPLYLIVRAK